MKSSHRNILLLCFFTSGATSLTFEVAWSKQLSYLLGNGLHAVSTVVAAFMAGLALGSWLASRYGDRVPSPLLWYGGIQMGVAIFGAASVPLFRHSGPIFRWVYGSFGLGHGSFLSVRFLAVFLLMSVPVTLMGVTLPLVVGALARKRDSYSYEAGLLYGVNTLGAVVGTLGSGYLLLPALGLFETCVAAGLVDAAAGIAAMGLSRVLPASGGPPEAGVAPKRRAKPVEGWRAPPPLAAGWTGKQWAVGLIFGISGAAAMFYELGWFRLLGLVMGPSVVAFSAMLGVYLAGVGLGSTFAARKVDKIGPSGLALMASIEALLGLAGCAGFLYFNDLPALYMGIYGASGAGPWLSHLGLAAVVVLPPCLLMGAIFPSAVRALGEAGPRRSPEANLGRLYWLNTVGAIAGSLAAGFWLIPTAGLGVTLASAGICSGALGAALFVLGPGSLAKRGLVALIAVGSCATLARVSPPLDILHLNLGAYRGLYARGGADRAAGTDEGTLLFYREGLNAPVAVYNFDGEGSLRVTGKADASTGQMERVTQAMLGHLPILFTPAPSRVAIVGYGSGMTAGAVLAHPEVKSADILEIEGAVIEASPFFECLNRGALRDPRANLVVEDARTFLANTDRTYDAITMEPSNPWMAGVSNLFTTDFYRIVRSRLAPEGVLCFWVQTYESSEEIFRVILASIREVFPHVVLFHNRGDTLLLCSGEPIRMDWGKLSGRFRAPAVAESLRRIGIREPSHLWTYFRAGDSSLDEYLHGEPQKNTDDNVWLEHHAIRGLLKASASGGAQKLNEALAGLGAECRLSAFEALCEGAPRERILGEGVRTLFAPEPILEEGGMIDPLKDVRDASVSGLRKELSGESREVREAFDRWVGECEAYRKARFDATAQLLQLPPGEPSDRLQRMEGILRLAPDLPMANNALADFLITEGKNYDASEPYYRAAAEDWTSSNCYGARINLGNIALIRSNFEGKDLWKVAEADYRGAIIWNPFKSRAFVSLAQLHLLHGDPAAALRVLEEGLQFNPEARDILEKRAEARAAAQGRPLVPPNP